MGKWILIIIFWILIIWGLVYIGKFITPSKKEENEYETALDILKKRYAKGEISKEEFEEKKKDLQV